MQSVYLLGFCNLIGCQIRRLRIIIWWLSFVELYTSLFLLSSLRVLPHMRYRVIHIIIYIMSPWPFCLGTVGTICFSMYTNIAIICKTLLLYSITVKGVFVVLVQKRVFVCLSRTFSKLYTKYYITVYVIIFIQI